MRLSAAGQLLESLAVALLPSSLGLVAYAILREAYVWFYQKFGVASEEVGLHQTRMLSSMFRFIHLWAWSIPGSPATNIIIVLLAAGALVGLWRWLLSWPRRRSSYIDVMADRHPVLLGISIVVLLIILSFAWALPLDRSLAAKRLQLGRAVHPAELAYLSIEADPVRVTWIGPGRPPKELLTAKLVYLGKADGVIALYQPPAWRSCPSSLLPGRHPEGAGERRGCCAWRSIHRTVTRHSSGSPGERRAEARTRRPVEARDSIRHGGRPG